jgi:hypothetical protein
VGGKVVKLIAPNSQQQQQHRQGTPTTTATTPIPTTLLPPVMTDGLNGDPNLVLSIGSQTTLRDEIQRLNSLVDAQPFDAGVQHQLKPHPPPAKPSHQLHSDIDIRSINLYNHTQMRVSTTTNNVGSTSPPPNNTSPFDDIRAIIKLPQIGTTGATHNPTRPSTHAPKTVDVDINLQLRRAIAAYPDNPETDSTAPAVLLRIKSLLDDGASLHSWLPLTPPFKENDAKGKDTDTDTDGMFERKVTPLGYAVRRSKVAVVKLLLERGANATDSYE